MNSLSSENYTNLIVNLNLRFLSLTVKRIHISTLHLIKIKYNNTIIVFRVELTNSNSSVEIGKYTHNLV